MGAGAQGTWAGAESRGLAAGLVDAVSRQAERLTDPSKEILGVSEATILSLRARGAIETRNPERVVLLPLPIDALKSTRPPEGIVLRMRSPRWQLDGAAPLDLLTDPVESDAALHDLARAERGEPASRR